jgi:predicted ATPase
MTHDAVIRTPDQRLRVFVSSTLGELAAERAAVREAIETLRLVPVMFELGARPHPPRELYRAYLEQSQVFVGIYWQRYGWVAPGEEVSGLEDEYRLAGTRPRLIYLKEPAEDRDPELARLLADVRDDGLSYKRFRTPEELADLVQQDLAVLLTERFAAAAAPPVPPTARPPAPLTPIVGRERERREVAALLADGVRLITLTGPGGIGKSRLGLAVAEDLADRFADGVHVVPLAAVESPDHLLPTVAARLAVGTVSATDAVAVLHHHLARRRVLLVLDNLEQIDGAGGVLAELLERCPGVQVLATSRRPLRLAGEHTWPVQPLEYTGEGASLAEVAASPAADLFVQRARAADPAFVLDERNATPIAELCRRLDGLPLAIELAAARARLLPPASLLRRLGDRLDLLRAGDERPERQRTLRATIDWSARLLTEREQAVIARLSVFRGGCTLAAAEEVCDLEGAGDVLDAVATLVDHSLVAVAGDTIDEEPRLRMLETVRAHAAERLEARGETVEVRRRHLDWYARLADTAQPFLCGPEQVRWIARVEPERENLRAAATAGLELGEPATVLEMAWDLYVYYYLRGDHDEPEGWVHRIAAGSGPMDERQRAIMETAFAISALYRGEPEGTEERLAAALETFEAAGAEFEAAVAEMHLGLRALEARRWLDAAAHERDAIERFESLGHDWGVASCENLLGVVTAARGDLDGASAHHQRALTLGRRIANASISAQALVLLAANALDRDETAAAASRLAEAVPSLVHARDVVGACGWLEVRAALALAEDDPETATTALAVADATRRRLGTPLSGALVGRVERLGEEVGARAGPELDRWWQAGRDREVFAVVHELAGDRDALAR